jgi:HK97 family phage major capsid protein
MSYTKQEVERMIAEARGGREAAAAETLEKMKTYLRDLSRVEEGRPLTPGEQMWRTTCEQFIENEKRKNIRIPASAQFGGGGNYGRSDGGPFKSFGEQLRSIAQAGMPGGQIDGRLFEVRATGLNETVPSEGGFLVQQDFSNEILQAAFEVGKLGKLCRRIQISSNANSIKIPGLDETSRATGSRYGGTRSYWIDEAGEKQASKPKFRQIELNLHKNVVLVYSTDELLQDATVLESVIRTTAASEIAFSTDLAIISGTGAGQPLGILNSGAVVTVAKESGQRAATIVWENVVKMWSRMIGNSRSNAVWLINQDIESQLYSMSLAIGTAGQPVFMPAGGATGAPYASLFGRPIIPCEQCSTLGTVGDIILASFQDGYILAEKGGISSDVSIHARFIYDESVFRFVYRVDGQPVLASAITPYKGSDKVGHFIVLAERS